MANNTPTNIFEALLFLWSRAAEGKDRRPLTDEEREMLDERDLGGTTSYYSFGVEIHDAGGTPYVWGAWSHAMTWQFFQGRQAGIKLLVAKYARQEYSEFVGFDEKLQGVLKYLESLQPHFPLFLDYMLDGCPALADEWPAPTDKQLPAQPGIVINLEVQQSAQAKQLKPRKMKPTGKRHPRQKLTDPTPRQMEAHRLHVDQRLSGQDLADALGIKSRSAAWRLAKEAKRLINGKKRQSVRAKARYDETDHRK